MRVVREVAQLFEDQILLKHRIHKFLTADGKLYEGAGRYKPEKLLGINPSLRGCLPVQRGRKYSSRKNSSANIGP
jgi:hypothetical protein